MPNQERRVPGISIVCVFNDLEMRQDCLDRSIAAYTGDVGVDYIPVDNRQQEFTSAGAALNHGAASARYDVVVFVHQDVYLHSIDRIATVATALEGGQWGLLGASGVSWDGKWHLKGRMRDRVVLVGEDVHEPVEVQSLDEVLFLVRRERVLTHPLSTDPDLAWHAYAVEYGLRMIHLGLKVGAANLAITHNSRSVNLDRLDVAHRRIHLMYPDLLPVATTCGLIGHRSSRWRARSLVRAHGWRFTWLVRSMQAVRARRTLENVPIVLSDIRTDVDLLSFHENAPLTVINLDTYGGFAVYAGEPVRLLRSNAPVVFRAAASLEQLLDVAGALLPNQSVLLADLDLDALSPFVDRLTDRTEWLLGVQDGTAWLLGGPVLRNPPPEWTVRKAIPLGDRRWRRVKGPLDSAAEATS